MRVLITGNMGYIGPVLTKYLKSHISNIYLEGFDSGYFASSLMDKKNLPEIYLDNQYFGDVRKFPESVLKDIDSVVYLSAISNDPMGMVYEKVTDEINYKSALDVARKSKAAGVKYFVFASSCSIYGFAEGDARDENSELNPLTAYARSKVNSENSLRDLADDSFMVTCLRFATACGMSPRLRLDLVLNDFIASAISTGILKILSDGTPWRPLIHVQDMSRAIHWAIQRGSDAGGNFLAVNVGTDEWNFQVKELAQAIGEVINKVEVSINKDAQPDKRSYRVKFDLFKKLAPGFQPKVTLIQAIEELYKGLIENQFSDPDFRSSEYIRLIKLNNLKHEKFLDSDLYWIR